MLVVIKKFSLKKLIGKNISIFYRANAIKAGKPVFNLDVSKNGSFARYEWRIKMMTAALGLMCEIDRVSGCMVILPVQ